MNCENKKQPDCWYKCPDRGKCEELTYTEIARLKDNPAYKAGYAIGREDLRWGGFADRQGMMDDAEKKGFERGWLSQRQSIAQALLLECRFRKKGVYIPLTTYQRITK